MRDTDILIIGAGAAGLMAAYVLSKAGKKVILVEARDRIGGRIQTLNSQSSFKHIELGAEFVHGNLPITMQLLSEAGIEFVPAAGEFWHHDGEGFSKDQLQLEGWEILMQKLSQLEEDMTVGDFLQQNFGHDKYAPLRDSVTKFISGYDTAELFRASAFALRAEWQGEDDDAQYRVAGGYGRMVNYLADQSQKNGVNLLLNTTIKEIYWSKGDVTVTASGSVSYHAEKVIVALPLGVLCADNDTVSSITFHPEVAQHSTAITKIGFGAIVKILLEFDEAFWESKATAQLVGYSLSQMSFLLSNEEIPTWWTQFPTRSNLITGWLGGPPAEKKRNTSNEEFLQLSLRSLANIFKCDITALEKSLVTWKVVNWTADPYTLGSYAYDTVESHDARKLLTEPVADKIYFAGEYLYEGSAMGTVEAALTSGREIARKLL